MIDKHSGAGTAGDYQLDYQLDVATLLDLPIPRECIEGIEANCALLRLHARKVEAFDIPDEMDEAIES